MSSGDGTLGLSRRPVSGNFWWFYIAVLVGSVLIQMSGLSIGRWGLDAAAHERAVSGGGGATSVADFVVAELTPFFGFGAFPNLVPTLILAYVISRIAFQGGAYTRALILYLSFPIVFQLQFVSKEAIVTLFVSAIFIVNSSRIFRNFASYISIGLLLLLALQFRQYYFISLAFCACLLFLPKPYQGILAMVAGIVIASLVTDIRDPLLTTRYNVYNGVSDGAVSKIPLFFNGMDSVSFIGNYFSSLFLYTFPILTGFRAQELYMQLYMVIVFYLSARAWKSGNRLMFSIFMGMMLTLPIFVAEVGTIARHLSGIIPILLMSLYFPKQEPSVRQKQPAANLDGRRFGTAPKAGPRMVSDRRDMHRT